MIALKLRELAARIEGSVMAHPDQPLPVLERLALAVWRASRRFLLTRLILTTVTAVIIVAVAGVSALFTLVITFTGILAIVTIEEWSSRLRL